MRLNASIKMERNSCHFWPRKIFQGLINANHSAVKKQQPVFIHQFSK